MYAYTYPYLGAVLVTEQRVSQRRDAESNDVIRMWSSCRTNRLTLALALAVVSRFLFSGAGIIFLLACGLLFFREGCVFGEGFVRCDGFMLAREVPSLSGTNAKVCKRCDFWFAARKREKVCTSCLPAKMRTERALRYSRTGGGFSTAKTAGQRGSNYGLVEVFSEELNLTFRCPKNDPRAASLLCRVLAWEEAAKPRNR